MEHNGKRTVWQSLGFVMERTRDGIAAAGLNFNYSSNTL